MPNPEGWTYYNNIRTCQQEDFISVFPPFLLTENFTDILEIGTNRGGLTLLLKHTLPACNIVTYDVMSAEELGLDIVIDAGVTFKQKNIFDSQYNVVDQEFLDLIKNSGKLLILVDGGNKPAEFNGIAPHLRVGDFIMCHDYISDSTTFETTFLNKIWNFHEISEAHIENACNQYNLQSVYPEFNNIVWQCKKKIS